MSDVQELNINSTTYDIKAKTVVDTNSGAVKMWTGTQAQYEAIATKDSNTIYNVDDTSAPVIAILDALYPIGAIYIGTMSACPLATLNIGTWQLVAQDRVLQGSGTRGISGTTINESLPNIKGAFFDQVPPNHGNYAKGAFSSATTDYGTISVSKNYTTSSTTTTWYGYAFDASLSSSVYQNNSPVQQDGYIVNIWERIS